MKIRNLLFVFILSLLIPSAWGQNLLDTSSWTVGSGSVSGFGQNGSSSENIRELGLNHVGENVVLWKAVPDTSNNADGGWNSSYLTIDNTNKYRLSVWIKKTNSNDGYSYFGCQQWQPNMSVNSYTILNTNNTVNSNPYFWVGDLPKLDRWYLLVGFVHGKNTSVTVNEGAIYDGVTGELVQNITDFKFNTVTSVLRHRAYLYYDTNTSDRQYFSAPRMEQINGAEYTINELLSLNPYSKLVFAYDLAGNQKQRFYCPDGASCSIPTPPAGKSTKEKDSVTEELVDLGDQIILYPNPTKGIINIKIETQLLAKTESIKIYSSNSSLIKTLKVGNPNQDLKVDFTDMPSGVYFIHIHMNDGSKGITKKIIKN